MKARRSFVASVAAGLCIVTAMPASAVDGYQESVRGTPSGNGGCGDSYVIARTADDKVWGRACFVADGDQFWLYDERSDGYSVGVQWHLTDGSRRGLIRDKLGADINTVLNKDFPESATVRFRFGKCDATATVDCHDAADYVDWSPQISGIRAWLCIEVDTGAARTC